MKSESGSDTPSRRSTSSSTGSLEPFEESIVLKAYYLKDVEFFDANIPKLTDEELKLAAAIEFNFLKKGRTNLGKGKNGTGY